MKYVICAKATGKEMTYDGEKFSERTPVQFATKKGAATKGRQLIRLYPILRRYRVYVRPAGKIGGSKKVAVPKRRRNPDFRDPELNEAAALLTEFSGHEPSEVIRLPDDRSRKGLVVGQLDGVLYSTVRDGKPERYIHKFRRKSRPLLTASHDGKQLGIVGGQFQFTEAGIEDR